MGRQIIWTAEALEHLESILAYWENRNTSKVFSVKLDRLFQDCLKQLSKYPNSGRSTKYNNVHYRIIRDYFIYYSFTDSEVEVPALCDMRRDPDYIK